MAGANRVVVGLPERYEKAKRAIRELEDDRDALKERETALKLLLGQRRRHVLTDKFILDELEKIYG